MNNNLNNHKKKLFLLIAFALFMLSSSLVFAATSTDSAAQEEEENKNSYLDGVKKALEKGTEQSTTSANLRTKKAYLAKVLKVSQETLTVNNYAGNKIVPLEEDVIIQKKDKDVDVGDIAVDSWVGIYEEANDNNLKITKVIVYDKDFTPKNKMITLGSIASIGKNDVAILPRSDQEELHFSFDKNTVFQDNRGEEIAVDDLYNDLQCLVVAFEDKNGNYVVSTIRALSSFEK